MIINTIIINTILLLVIIIVNMIILHANEAVKKHLDKDKKIIMDLVQGIEKWALDEDGVHNDCFDAYLRAKKRVTNN